MKKEPMTVVTEFLHAVSQGRDGMINAIKTWFSPYTVWDNVGYAKTTGPDEALAICDSLGGVEGFHSIRMKTLAIAANGTTVLTERIDYLLNAKGETILTAPLMGVFEVDENGQFIRWADYTPPHPQLSQTPIT